MVSLAKALSSDTILLLASGAFRTQILVSKYTNLVTERKTPPENVVLLTKTGSAVVRISQDIMSKNNALGLMDTLKSVKTVHALCGDIVRANTDKLSRANRRTRNFSIWNDEDATATLQHIVQNDPALKFYQTNFHFAMSDVKKTKMWGQPSDKPHVNMLRMRYDNYLQQSNAIDFDDLVLFARQILKDNANEQLNLQPQLKHILMDSMEELTVPQCDVLKSLLREGKQAPSWFATYNSDSSSFNVSFNHILALQRAYFKKPPVPVVDGQGPNEGIMDKIAHAFITGGQQVLNAALGKHLVLQPVHPDKEIEYIAQTIKELQATEGAQLSEIAVLCRQHLDVASITEQLPALGVPTAVSRVHWTDSEKTILAFMQLVQNPVDLNALMKVLQGWSSGKDTLATARTHALAVRRGAEALGHSDVVAALTAPSLEGLRSYVPPEAFDLLAPLGAQLAAYKADLESGTPMAAIVGKYGLPQPEATPILADCARLFDSPAELTGAMRAEKFLGLAAYLYQYVALTKPHNAVMMSTIQSMHAARYRYVFLAGAAINAAASDEMRVLRLFASAASCSVDRLYIPYHNNKDNVASSIVTFLSLKSSSGAKA